MDRTSRYWFAAKRDGRGWGLPLTWQGWVVYVLWFLALIVATPYLAIPEHPVRGLFAIMGMVVPLAAICYLKGEPLPRRGPD